MQVFLSHSTVDGPFVDQLASELLKNGIAAWHCEKNIEYGDDFVAKIDEGLSKSDLSLLILSPDAVASEWTRKEWTAALARETSESRIRLSVLLLRDCEVPQLLRTKHRFDARTNPDAEIQKVVLWAIRQRDQRRLADSKAPRAILAYEPKDFVGRERYLDHLQTALADQPGVYLLHGEPGCGKSTIALKFAWKVQSGFDVVVFQPCGQRTAEEIAVELAGRLNLEDVRSAPPEKQLEAVHNCLRERLSLLVLDDVSNHDAQKLLPGPPVSVLVTSRLRNWSWIESSSRELVEKFSPEEAEACFRKHLGDADVTRYRAPLMAFANRMDYLPIAIAVAAGMLRDSADPIAEAAGNLHLAELQSVLELLQKAIDAQPEPERKLLQAAAVCAPDGFWMPLAAQIAGLDDAQARLVRDRLVNASLLRIVDRDRRRFQLHALLREQLREIAPLADLESRHAAALEVLFKERGTRWMDCLECLDEVIPAMEYLWRSGEAGRMGWLSYAGFALGNRTGELEAAFRILAREQSFWAGRDDRRAKDSLQRTYGNQALILKAWGRLEEAMALHKKEEAICLELGDKNGLQACYGNQAGILIAWGRLEEAMALLGKQEAICLELGNKDSLQRTYGNQALILKAWGRLEEAMDLHKKEEAICLELGNKDSLQRTYGNQALILKAWGRLDEATALHKKEEAICLELGLRADLAYSYGNQGLLARDRNDHPTERAKLQAALEIFTALNMPRQRDAVAAELQKTIAAGPA